MLIDNEVAEVSVSSLTDGSVNRASVRYIRKDLKAYLLKYSLFKTKPLKVKLEDISSRGVRISTRSKIRVNKKLLVGIRFLDGYKFLIDAVVVRNYQVVSYVYDFSFQSIDDYIYSQNSTFSKVYLMVSGSRIESKYGNIMSNKVQVLSGRELDKKNKVILGFEFNNGELVEREAAIIGEKKIKRNYYGIKFNKANSLLGNYLLKTQKNLVFG